MSSTSHFIEYNDVLININDISFVIFDSSNEDASVGTVTIHFKSGNKHKFDSDHDKYLDFGDKILDKDG